MCMVCVCMCVCLCVCVCVCVVCVCVLCESVCFVNCEFGTFKRSKIRSKRLLSKR